MQSLLADDLYWVRRRLSRPVVQLMKQNAGKAVIAGGFIRSCVSNELINDIDMFAPSKELALAWAHQLAALYKAQPGFGNKAKVHVSQNAYTIIGIPTTVQIIHRWTYEKPEDVIGSFDFTIARAAMWWEPWTESERTIPKRKRTRRMRWVTMLDDRFYADLAARRLIYCSPVRNEDAGGSMLRVLKFYQRGFRIPLPSLGAVTARLAMGIKWSEIDRGHPTATEEQLAKVLSGLLREVDPAIDPDHIMHLPTPEEEGDDDEDDVAEQSPPSEAAAPTYPFWVEFQGRGAATVYGTDKADAGAKAAEITNCIVTNVSLLPYAAMPVLNGSTEGAFCFQPGQCAGRGSCPRNPSCTD